MKCELHHCCDASMSTYGSVSYLRALNAERNIHRSRLLGKSRLAPIRQMTNLARLELSVAVIAVRMDQMPSRVNSLWRFKTPYSGLTAGFFFNISTVAVRGSKPLWRTGCLSFMMGQGQVSGGRLAPRKTPLMMSPEV